MKYRVSMKRVEGGSALRTPTIDGECDYLPRAGFPFVMTSAPLTLGAVLRVVTTSIVQSSVRTDDVFLFKTENSTYRLTVLPADA